MYAHSLKRTLRKQEERKSEYTTFLKGMDSSSVRLDYTEDFEFITSVSLCLADVERQWKHYLQAA